MTTPDSSKTYHNQAQKFFEQTAKKKRLRRNSSAANLRLMAASFFRL